MKRILAIVLAASLLSGCSGGVKIEANESTFLIGIRNRCDCEIYKVHHEYYLGNKPVGGGYICNADGSAISFGDMPVKDFIQADFPEGANLAEFCIEVFVTDGTGKKHSCGEALRLNAAYGNEYQIIITGNEESGFYAVWGENA